MAAANSSKETKEFYSCNCLWLINHFAWEVNDLPKTQFAPSPSARVSRAKQITSGLF